MGKNKIVEKKSFWKKFNPTLKEIEEKHPNISILGLWWSWYWRLALLVIGVVMGFWIISLLASLVLYVHYS